MKNRDRVRRMIASKTRSNAAVYLQIIILTTSLVWLLVSMKSLTMSLTNAFTALADMGIEGSDGSGDSSAIAPDDDERRSVSIRTDIVFSAPAAEGSAVPGTNDHGIGTDRTGGGSGDSGSGADDEGSGE